MQKNLANLTYFTNKTLHFRNFNKLIIVKHSKYKLLRH